MASHRRLRFCCHRKLHVGWVWQKQIRYSLHVALRRRYICNIQFFNESLSVPMARSLRSRRLDYKLRGHTLRGKSHTLTNVICAKKQHTRGLQSDQPERISGRDGSKASHACRNEQCNKQRVHLQLQYLARGRRANHRHLGSLTAANDLRTGCLSILMLLTPLAEVTP